MESLDLYGVKVDAARYCLIKILADILTGLSKVDEPLRWARQRAVRAAIDAIAVMEKRFQKEKKQ